MLYIAYCAIFLVKIQVDGLTQMFILLQVIELIFMEMDIATTFNSNSIIEDFKSLEELPSVLIQLLKILSHWKNYLQF